MHCPRNNATSVCMYRYLNSNLELSYIHLVLWPRIVLHETMTRFVLPLCDSLPHKPSTPVSSVTTIIDLAEVSLSTMWSLRSHLQQASTMATAHYPETLNAIAIVNSPSFFPTIWNWIKACGTKHLILLQVHSLRSYLRVGLMKAPDGRFTC